MLTRQPPLSSGVSLHTMSRTFILGLTLVCCTATATATSIERTRSSSLLVGSWTAISDEDHTPADFFEITANGKYINYGFNCSVRHEAPTHWWNGDLYVTNEIFGKGPISIVFRPSADGNKLTFTSPRTFNNAVYARIPSIPCLKSPH
jgi:hypothetical protein